MDRLASLLASFIAILTALASTTTVASASAPTSATLCPKWDPAIKIGDLDPAIIDESSGLTISRSQNAIYHMNDSGTPPEFHVTDLSGGHLKTVHIDDYKPIDPEETSIGPCPLTPNKTCLVIEDIGDNLSRRKQIAFLFIEEKNPWPKSVKPQFIARFTYPDGAHNAEAATVLDNGDIVLFTKELSILGSKATPAKVFRSTRDQYVKATSTVRLKQEGTLDLPSLNGQHGLGGVATGMATTSDGKRFAILTYSGAMEFSIDLHNPFPTKITPDMWSVIPLFQLPQQESIAYDRGDRDLVYSTEIRLSQRFFGKRHPAPLYKVKCSLSSSPHS